jgi:hypothetical protein
MYISNLKATHNSRPGIVWLRISVLYLLVGVTLGICMGAAQNFTLRPVHAHVNLLGWATCGLAGLIYSVYPAAARNKLAKLHFWCLNLALPIMMASLSALLLGHMAAGLPLVVSELLAAAGIVAFAANIFFNLHWD